ncbi:MAG: periplasmic heavy metal sensor [Rhizobacter sp.]|nr:periplasmic heavy metal sensor [Rhizobacter sp.]
MKTHSHPIALACINMCLAFAAGAATAQTATPYADEQARPIKALSERDVQGLLQGQGAGLAKPAELNGYPGPAHTLELQEPLGLTPEQATATASLMQEHKRRARELGAALVEAERRLDALFAERRADAAAVEQNTREVALLQARLRAEHLTTHLTQTALLSAEQVRRYAELRGYASASPAAPTHKHH